MIIEGAYIHRRMSVNTTNNNVSYFDKIISAKIDSRWPDFIVCTPSFCESVNKTYFSSFLYHIVILKLLHCNRIAVFLLFFCLSKHEFYKPLRWWLLKSQQQIYDFLVFSVSLC